MPREILVDWTTPAGGGFRTVLFFGLGNPVADQRADIGTLLGTIDNLLDSNTLWTVETSGRELDDATGSLTGVWSDSIATNGAGMLAGQCVPDAAQVLLRWTTDTIVNGRFVKGHSFIPGLSTANILEGNLAAATVTTIQGAVNAFVADANAFGVWHRPVGGAGGVFVECDTGSVWPEFAVLRRRRG